MRYCSFLILFLLATTSVRAETPWEKYLVEPTPENAKSVAAIEYSSDNSETNSDFLLLESQVVSGDVEAFELTLRLAEHADGGDLHDLKIIASRAIRPHPSMFLDQVEANPQSTYMLKSAIITVGEEYVDRPVARRYELQARYDALKALDVDSDEIGLAEFLVVLTEAIEDLEWASTNAGDCDSIVGYEDSIIFVECESLDQYGHEDIGQIVADIFASRDWEPDEYLIYFVSSQSLADTFEGQEMTGTKEWGDSLIASYYTHSHEVTLWPNSQDKRQVIPLGPLTN